MLFHMRGLGVSKIVHTFQNVFTNVSPTRRVDQMMFWYGLNVLDGFLKGRYEEEIPSQ